MLAVVLVVVIAVPVVVIIVRKMNAKKVEAAEEQRKTQPSNSPMGETTEVQNTVSSFIPMVGTRDGNGPGRPRAGPGRA